MYFEIIKKNINNITHTNFINISYSLKKKMKKKMFFSNTIQPNTTNTNKYNIMY